MWIAPNGHFLGQMPHPMQRRSEMKEIFDSGVTSIQSLPVRTTGQDFLHSCRHFLFLVSGTHQGGGIGCFPYFGFALFSRPLAPKKNSRRTPESVRGNVTLSLETIAMLSKFRTGSKTIGKQKGLFRKTLTGSICPPLCCPSLEVAWNPKLGRK